MDIELPLNQIIVSDPDAASLTSDNLEALVGFYRDLGSAEERERFKRALLDRLAPNKGYLAVSYFIVAVLWTLGSLPEALEKAKRALPQNETRVFGLSNVLMLLNGLLKYRYPDFTNDMLDDIERMTHGLTEHTFMIPAKIAGHPHTQTDESAANRNSSTFPVACRVKTGRVRKGAPGDRGPFAVRKV